MDKDELIDLQLRLIANLSSLRSCAVTLGDLSRMADLDAQLEAAEAKLEQLRSSPPSA